MLDDYNIRCHLIMFDSAFILLCLFPVRKGLYNVPSLSVCCFG